MKLRMISGLEYKNVICSKCNYKGKVAEFQHIEDKPVKPAPTPVPAPKPTPKPEPKHTVTSIPSGTVINPNAKVPSVGKLRDEAGMEYPLQFGLNTVGRNAVTSTAMIRINDQESRISREHLIIEVKIPVQVKSDPGHTATIAVSNIPSVSHIVRLAKQQVNKTYLNDVLMAFGFEYNLKPGDRIKLPGNKILTFI